MKHAPRLALALTALCTVALTAPAQAQSWNDRQQHSGAGHVTAGYMLRTSWMRAGPVSDYPAIRRISRSAQVSVYGCLRDWSWCDVGYRQDRGWVRGRDIAASYQGRRRSINMIAPRLGIIILSFSFGGYWDDHYRTRSFYRERDTWQRRYEQNYQPSWGPRQESGSVRTQPRTSVQPRQSTVQPHKSAPVAAPPVVRPKVQQHAPGAAPVKKPQSDKKANRQDHGKSNGQTE